MHREPDLELELSWPPSTSHAYIRRSMKFGGKGMMMTTDARRYKAAAQAIARKVMQQAGHAIQGGNIAVVMDLYPPTRRKTDIDNRNKLVFDALEGTVFHDDSQIVELLAKKHQKSDRPGVGLRIWFDYAEPTDKRVKT